VFRDVKLHDSCMVELKKFLANNKWKGTRYSTKGLYAMELINNGFTLEAYSLFCEAFLETIVSNRIELAFPVIATTLRFLAIEKNNLGDSGAATLCKYLDNSRCLVMVSLKENNIGIGGAAHIAKALTYNTQLKYLCLASNPLENYGIAQIGKALKSNKSLEMLDLTDVYFTDDACLSLNEGLLLNRTLRKLILSNTYVGKTPSTLLINTVKNSKNMKVLRWGNLKFFAEAVLEYTDRKIISVEYLKNPVAPYIQINFSNI
jgi:Ran GTPase-activating protein (RanGAP) involved in mRNA processing and transport